MPQTAHQHRDHQVQGGAGGGPPRPAQRVIHVVAQEAGEGHVPAAPELADVRGGVGLAEVLGQVEAEQQRQPAGQVGVAAEVEVDLRGVRQQRQQQRRPAVLLGHLEGVAHQMGGQIAGQHQLLGHPRQHQRHGPLHLGQAFGRGLGDLGQQLVGPADGAGQQLGEKRHEQQEIQQGRRRLGFGPGPAAVAIHQVTDALEHVKRQAHRGQQLQHGQVALQSQPAGRAGDGLAEEVVQLQRRQQADVGGQPDPQQDPGGARRSRAGDGLAQDPVHQRQGQQPRGQVQVPAGVEGVAGRQQDAVAGRPPPAQRPGEREHQEKEVPEGDAGEGHGARPGDRTRMLGIPVWRSRVGWGTPGPRACGVHAASGDDGIRRSRQARPVTSLRRCSGRRCRRCRSSRRGSWPGTAGGTPRRSRTPVPGGCRW